ncbi:MAG TPA: tetratricopeptide repeat protein [Sorangium sp.]|nr:tetratricopeptide repeat protein [Sorangium sp.]
MLRSTYRWLRQAAVLLFLTVTLCAGVWLQPRQAYAQPSDADRATARQLAIDANAALQAQEYDKAADLFKRADALYHAPTLGLGLGRAYRGMGKYVQARETLNRVIRETLPADASPKFKKAVASARKEADEIKNKIAWITVTITPTEAAVSIDGVLLPSAALGVRRAIDPGKHQLTSSARGYASDEQTITLGEGDSKAVTITLKSITTTTPPTPTPMPGGGASGVDNSDEDPGALMRTLGFVGLGVGGASLVVGSITGGLAVGKHGDLTDQCNGNTCPATAKDDLRAYRTLGNVSTATLIVGGVLATTGLVLVLVAPSADEEPSANARRRQHAPRYRAHIGPTYLGASIVF